MSDCIFLAGAAGAVGRRLVPLLVADGYRVFGTTRAAEKAAALRAQGAEPVVVDVFDAAALRDAVVRAQPAIVIHQLTDLPPGLDPARMPAALPRNARIREEGTRNLVAAAQAAGARRLVAQSIAFAYAPGPAPHREGDPLAASAASVASLEQQVMAAGLACVVLRYGRFYGPGTGRDTPEGPGPVHVDAAAQAARLAVTRGAGIYNVAEDDGALDCTRAQAELGWSPAFRIG